MEYRRLGRTDINVSSICLGTMTWGEQNTEAEAHEQLDYSMEQGVNFIQTCRRNESNRLDFFVLHNRPTSRLVKRFEY
jgi:predicted aldo/keto reductase-like oxidoreductase